MSPCSFSFAHFYSLHYFEFVRFQILDIIPSFLCFPLHLSSCSVLRLDAECHFTSVSQLSYVPHVGDLLVPRSPPLAGLSGSLDLLP